MTEPQNAQTTWTPDEIRQLRYRLGWSRAEMARNLNLDLYAFFDLETGRTEVPDQLRSSLVRILYLVEMNAEKIHRRPIAEVMMKQQGLSQIHDMDVIDALDNLEKSTPSA